MEESKDYITLVEKHYYKKGQEDFNTLDNLCFLSKNLYNASLYEIRQHFFNTGKFLGYYDLERKFKNENNPDYRNLPAKASQHVIKLVCQGFYSFFSLLRLKKEGKYDGVTFHRIIRSFMIQTGDPNTRPGHEAELAAAEADTTNTLGETIPAEFVYGLFATLSGIDRHIVFPEKSRCDHKIHGLVIHNQSSQSVKDGTSVFIACRQKNS